MQVEEGNHYLMSKEEMENQIATLTGGRAAEEVVFHTSTSGASNDIEKATRLARAMITRFGMSDEFGMVAMETVTNQYLGGDTTLACSPETQARIDKAVSALIKKQYEKAVQILENNRRTLDALAKFLYEKETITGEQFMGIVEEQKKASEGNGSAPSASFAPSAPSVPETPPAEAPKEDAPAPGAPQPVKNVPPLNLER